MSRRPRTPHRAGEDTGQASVEFALALPLILVLVLGIVQVLVIGSRQASIERLARDGARVAGVSAEPQTAARRAVESSTRLRPIEVHTDVRGDTVSVTVRFVDPTSVPIIGHAIGDVTLTATATMPREPP